MKYLKRAAMLAIAVAVFLVSATAASAATAPGYEEFSDCPDKTVDAAIGACVSVRVDEGHLQMGSKNSPIVDPITLVGGITSPDSRFIVGSFDGGQQPVPGGLVGITGLEWLTDLIPGGLLQVYAQAELAGTPGNPLGTVFTLPLKVKLINPLLSPTCYIGSDTDPIALRLTRFTTNPPPPNQPISGAPGTTAADPNLPNVIRITNRVFVDNAFAAPAARGCDLVPIGVIDALVNAQSGLPSPAGTNETVQVTDAALGGINAIYPPAGIEQ